MYTAYIGNKFLRLYNERKKTVYTARQFFDDVMFKVFFDAPKHALHVHNSKFHYAPGKNEDLKGMSVAVWQRDSLHRDIDGGRRDAGVFVGNAAAGIDGGTSGQVSNLDFPIDADTVYASWIGAGFGISTGELSFFCDDTEVLWAIYEGWRNYREVLDATPSVKGKQIETWNGHWLCYRWSDDYHQERKMPPLLFGKGEAEDLAAIKSKNWADIVFSLGRHFGEKRLIVNVFSFGQTNVTIGFLPLQLQEVHTLWKQREYLFGKFDFPAAERARLKSFYETELTFRRAAEFGEIGLQALRPKDIGKYFQKSKPDQKFKLPERVAFLNYQSWILAMLNNTEMYELAKQVAESLHAYRSGQEKGKTDRPHDIEDLFEAKKHADFVIKLADILKKDKEKATATPFDKLVDAVVKMPKDNFPLLSALIRFQYEFQHTTNKN